MAAGKISPRLLHAREPQKPIFVTKKRACGSLEDFTKLITYEQNEETHVSAQRKGPATARKTSPSLLHVENS